MLLNKEAMEYKTHDPKVLRVFQGFCPWNGAILAQKHSQNLQRRQLKSGISQSLYPPGGSYLS